MQIARFLPAMFLLAFFPALRAEVISEPSPELSPVYTDSQEKEYRFYPGGKIGISIDVPGNLKIVGWNRGSVRMEAEVKVHSLAEEKELNLLEKSPVRVRYTDAVSTIQVVEAPELKGLLEVNMVVYVPGSRTDLVVQMKKGDFTIDSVNGWVETTVGEGNLEMTAIDGYYSVKTQNGNILANLSGSRWNGQGFTAATREGRVDLLMPEKYSAVLQLDTQNGEITVDYPSQEVEGELIPPEVVSQKKARHLRARVGEGGAPLRLGTKSGDVSFTKQ